MSDGRCDGVDATGRIKKYSPQPLGYQQPVRTGNTFYGCVGSGEQFVPVTVERVYSSS
jgi:hypothetical protein